MDSFSFMQFAQQKRAAIACVAFLSVLLLLTLIQMIRSWSVESQMESSQLSTIDVPVHTASILKKTPDLHLFGQAPLQPDHLPQTNLALSLQGVLLSSDPKLSTAIIASQGQKGQVYKLGDTLPDGAVLYRVEENVVILKNQGRLERLPLVRPKLEQKNLPTSTWR